MRLLISVLLMSSTVLAQTPNFALNDATTYPVNRIGINPGQLNFYNSFPLKNLLASVNPSMQPQEVRQIKTVASGTNSPSYTFTTSNDWETQPANASAGWRVYFPCHGSSGASPGTCDGGNADTWGTITANTANSSSGSMTYTYTPDTSTDPPAANDSVWLYKPYVTTTPSTIFPNSNWLLFGWASDVSGSGTTAISALYTDTPPTLNGFANAIQCVQLANESSSDTSGVFTYFDTGGVINYNFNGTFTQSILIKVFSGSPTIEMWGQRGSTSWSQTATPTTSWTTVSTTWSASEPTTATPSNAQIGYRLHGAGSACILSAALTNNADTNPTAYRDQVVSDFNLMKPGLVRYNVEGEAGSSLLNIITPLAYRRTSAVTGPYLSATPVQPGLVEMLTLAEHVGANEFAFVVPPTYSGAEYLNLLEFLAGGTGTAYGGYRQSLGHSATWTSSFNKIIFEMGNETWNGGLEGGYAGYPSYGAYWNYVPLAISQCSTLKSSSYWDSSKMKCGVSVQTANGPYQVGLFTSTDTDHYVDLANANEYSEAGDYSSTFGPTSCSQTDLFTSAFVQPLEATKPGSSMGFYDTYNAGLPVYVYEYGMGSAGGSCNQSQLDGFAEGEGYGLTNTLMPQINARDLGIADQALWQYLEPQRSITTTAGNVSLNSFGIFDGSGGAFHNPRGTALAMSVVNSCIGNAQTGFSVSATDVPTFDFTGVNGVTSQSDVPYLFGFGYKDGSSRCLLVENIDLTNSRSFTISGTNAPSGSILRTLYDAASLTSNNEGANATPQITNTTSTISSGTYTIPAHSIVALQWSVTP